MLEHPALRRTIGCQARRNAPSAQREANEPLGIRLADAHKYLWADEPGASTKRLSGGVLPPGGRAITVNGNYPAT